MRRFFTVQKVFFESLGGSIIFGMFSLVLILGLGAHGWCASEASNYVLKKRDAIFNIWVGDQGTWAVGKRGLILRSGDGGKTWQQVPSGLGTSLNKIMFREDTGWIVGNDGLILQSKDKGAHWTKVASGERYDRLALIDIEFMTDQVGIVATEEGEILSSQNGGASWERYPLDWFEVMPADLTDRGIYAMNFYDIYVLDQDKAWIVGDWGTVMFTGDRGQHWEILRCGFYPHLFSAVFLDEQRGVAVGQNGTAVVTEDGGRSWTDMPGIKTSYSLFKIAT
ncbi:MAG TPA: YCF48-related protein, partial [Thermodesulfobacteriota bacterium]|nr:YCF48-related protein [Thermodesulfobacteriota bacterium]